jgi:hypothetical protein
VLGLSFAVWMMADGDDGLYFLFAALYGAAYSSIVVLRPLVILEWFGRERINTLTGAVFFLSGPGCPLGGYLFGLVYEAEAGTYDSALAVAVVLCVGAAALLWSLTRSQPGEAAAAAAPRQELPPAACRPAIRPNTQPRITLVEPM